MQRQDKTKNNKLAKKYQDLKKLISSDLVEIYGIFIELKVFWHSKMVILKNLYYDDFSGTRVTPNTSGSQKDKKIQIDPLELGLFIDYFFTQLFDFASFVVYVVKSAILQFWNRRVTKRTKINLTLNSFLF